MFSAKTTHSGQLKALFEVLFSNISTVCITISKEGISSETITTNNSLICVDLPASSFEEYIFTFTEPQHIGLGSHINNGFFKSLKNKTCVTLKITKPYILDVSAEDDGCSISYSAVVISTQNISPAPIYKYDNEGIDISCSNFNSMCKSFSKSNSLDVTKTNGQLLFSFQLVGIASRTLTFGSKCETDKSLYYQQFKSDAFIRVGKLASFADNIQLFVQSDLPLLILGTSVLGMVKIFMNSSQSE